LKQFLIDTNILIYLMNQKSERLREKFITKSPNEFCVSSVTVAELLYGAKKSVRVVQNTAAALKILSPFEIIDFSGLDAMEYADIRTHLEKQGCMIGGNDLLIASQSRRLNSTLITANIDEFSRVPGLKVENWVC